MELNNSEYTILAVDDVVSNILLLKVLLQKEGFRVITASNGPEALQAVGEKHPDLILLDVMMPGMDGFEVATKLKASETTREIPIIFLTALNNANDIVKGFQSGGSDFISKPFNKEELKIRISHQLRIIAAQRIITRQTEELQKTIQGRDKLYSVIAHDLRSPMGSIKMVLNMLMLNLPEEQIGKEMYEILNMANQTTEEAFSLLDNLLKWTKNQIGKLNVVYQQFDLTETTEGLIEIFTMSARLKNIVIELKGLEHASVYADIDMTKTIERNLLSNAIKFSPDGSTITIAIEEDEENAIVHVTDQGCGMSPEDQQKLFRMDTHFSTFGTNNEEGSGLGLLLCQDFVHKNGGRLWFESEKGKGSTFSFSLPKQKRKDDAPTPSVSDR